MKRQNLHVGIDVDGVLRDFQFQFAKYAQEIKGIDVEEEDFRQWGFPNVIKPTGGKLVVDVFANPEVGKFIFTQAPTITNAYTGFKLFTDHSNISVYIVSSQKKDYENFTTQWLENNGFLEGIQGIFYERNKLNAPVQILIDDKPENVIQYSQNKRDSILIDRPYNLSVNIPETIPRMSDMIEAYQYVKQRYRRYI